MAFPKRGSRPPRLGACSMSRTSNYIGIITKSQHFLADSMLYSMPFFQYIEILSSFTQNGEDFFYTICHPPHLKCFSHYGERVSLCIIVIYCISAITSVSEMVFLL